MKTKKKKDVEDLRQAVPGEVVVSWTDSSRSVAEGNGLEEAEFGREANFTITTKYSEGKQCYNENNKLAITIKAGEELMEKVIQERKNGDCVYHQYVHCM